MLGAWRSLTGGPKRNGLLGVFFSPWCCLTSATSTSACASTNGTMRSITRSRNWMGRVFSPTGRLLDSGRFLYRDGGLRTLSQSDAADPVAALVNAKVSGGWLTDRAYYHLELKSATDNPDQRISEDLNQFTSYVLTLSLGLLTSVVSLVSFLIILWGLSGPADIPFGDLGTLHIPAYLVWAALFYAGVGTWLTIKIGRPLVPLNFASSVSKRISASAWCVYGKTPRAWLFIEASRWSWRFPGTISKCLREFLADHEAPKASGLVYLGLRSSCPNFSGGGGRPPLLCQADWAGWLDAGGRRISPRFRVLSRSSLVPIPTSRHGRR